MPKFYNNNNQNPLEKAQKKPCPFCTNPKLKIDYKNEVLLNQFISGQAKIKKIRRTGVCAKHQRKLAKAIKRARNLGILPAAGIHNYFNIEEKRAEKEKQKEERERIFRAKAIA